MNAIPKITVNKIALSISFFDIGPFHDLNKSTKVINAAIKLILNGMANIFIPKGIIKAEISEIIMNAKDQNQYGLIFLLLPIFCISK